MSKQDRQWRSTENNGLSQKVFSHPHKAGSQLKNYNSNMLPSLPLERKDYKRDDLARASVKLRDPQGQQGSPPAPKPLKRTAAQAGLSAGPPIPEELLRKLKVVLGLLPESELKWYNVCTKIANIAVPNGYQDVV